MCISLIRQDFVTIDFNHGTLVDPTAGKMAHRIHQGPLSMSNARQILAMLQSRAEGDDEHFFR